MVAAMAERNDILRRKLGAAPADPGALTAWRAALTRAALDGIGLELTVVRATDDRRSPAELLDLVADNGLLAMLEGPQGGSGLLAIPADLLAAIIEAQTIGTIATTAPPPRRPTRIDAAMAAPLIDRALTLLAAMLGGAADFAWTAGFRYASFIGEARTLALLLEDEAHRTLGLTLTVAGTARGGTLLLALPARGRAPAPPPVRRRDHFDAGIWQHNLHEAVTGAEMPLTATIGRLQLPLHQVMGLAAGMILPLGTAGVDRIALETGSGIVVAEGLLGQHRGNRALRLRPTTIRPPAAPPDAAAPVAPPPLAHSA